MNRTVAWGLVALFGLSSAVGAGSFNETNSWWFLDPVTPNWTCAQGIQGKCYSTYGPNSYNWDGLFFIRKWGTLFSYVQGGSYDGAEIGVCEMPNGGDNFCVFTVPDQATGWTGSVGPVLQNTRPRPDDGWFWQLNSAFWDNDYGAFYLVVARQKDGAGTDTSFVVGESFDGIQFDWGSGPDYRPILKTDLSLARFTDLDLLPDPNNSFQWFGVLSYVVKQGSTQSNLITPVVVDWATNQVRVKTATGAWTQIPIGSKLTWLPKSIANGRVTGLFATDIGSGPRYEAWRHRAVSYSQGSGVENNPCPPGFPNGVPTQQYLTNRSSAQQLGSSVTEFRLFDPVSLTFTTPWTAITSEVRGEPSDYLHDGTWLVSHFDAGGRDYLYRGSKDRVICSLGLIWNPWAGSGILVTKVVPTP